MALISTVLVGIVALSFILLLAATVRRLARPLGISVCIGIPTGLLVAAVFEIDALVASAAATLAVFPFTFRRQDSPRQVTPERRVLTKPEGLQQPVLEYRFAVTPPQRGWWRRSKSSQSDMLLDAAWLAVAEHAQFAQARIDIARTSCSRLLRLADEDKLNVNLTEWALVIRKHVPALVEKCFDECRRSSLADRRILLENLICSLQKIAAEAEQRVSSGEVSGATPFDVARSHIHNRVAGI